VRRGGRFANAKRYDIPELGITVKSKDEVRIAWQIHAVESVVEYEQEKLPYIVPERKASYRPDFRLKNGIMVEYKGEFSPKDRAKHLHVRNAHPDLDIRFVFTNPDRKIQPSSKTSYADWCRENDFQFARKNIPEAWFKEKRCTA